MITVEPEGGLGNRLHVMHSGIALAAAIEQPLRIIWVKNDGLGCDLDAFLDVPPEINSLLTFSKLPWSRSAKLRYNIQRYARLGNMKPDFRGPDIERMKEEGFDFTEFGRRRHTHIKYWYAFYAMADRFYPFRPTAALRQRIEAISSGFDNTIGVHIRRTDHLPSLEYSPTAMFLEHMEALVEEDPSVSFYLSSDDAEEKDMVRSHFGERVITAPDTVPGRASVEAVQSSIVDMYCLSATRRIVGSFMSSFSETAAKLGNIPLKCIVNEEKPVIRWK